MLDPAGMVLLASSHDVDDPGRRWWYTLGGGIGPGEGPRQAAVREVLEESGIALAPDELLGPSPPAGRCWTSPRGRHPG
ncbi:NUDIX domain-containing protein [Tessaracoccus sp. HDW20]|nr:NUDIX domain-containing protein [Tessaracoccus coleopterorum]